MGREVVEASIPRLEFEVRDAVAVERATTAWLQNGDVGGSDAVRTYVAARIEDVWKRNVGGARQIGVDLLHFGCR